MLRKLPSVIALVALAALLAAPASAQPFGAGDCYVGPGLAATLLFPYFEVDLVNPLGVATLIAINNGLADPAMARVVVWTDWGNPTIAFDVYLEGFDVETINLVDLFNGVVPSTGEGADLSGFEFCDGLPPFHANPVLTADERAQMVADHTGVLGPIFPDCAGSVQADGIARGYVTVDVVDECSGVEGSLPGFTPATTGGAFPYFVDGGSSDGIAIATNRLWGDIVYANFTDNSAQGSEAIPVWANPDRFAGTDIFTFYGGFSGWDGRDERVPLPYVWDQRFLNGGPFAGGADLIVWRDTGMPPETAGCGSEPSTIPLKDTTEVWDLDTDTIFLGGNENFPLATQRTSIDSLSIPFDFGWMQLLFAPIFDAAVTQGQAWVQPSLNAAGVFSANFNGTPVLFLCDDDPTPAMAPAGQARAPSTRAPLTRALRPGVELPPRTSKVRTRE